MHRLLLRDLFLAPFSKSFRSISVMFTKSSLNSSLLFNQRSSSFSGFSSSGAFSMSARVGKGSTFQPPSIMKRGLQSSCYFDSFLALSVVSKRSISGLKATCIEVSFPLYFNTPPPAVSCSWSLPNSFFSSKNMFSRSTVSFLKSSGGLFA